MNMENSLLKVNNKAAMFGLDARIALAIFGALSVVSGAALYSAIKETRMQAVVNQMQEIDKALESYILDNGYVNDGSDWNLNRLLTNIDSQPTWKGPYISAKGAPSPRLNNLIVSGLGNTALKVVRPGTNSSCGTSFLSTASNVEFYLFASKSDDWCDYDIKWAKQIHDKFDSDGDYLSGKYIVYPKTSTTTDKGGLAYRVESFTHTMK